MQYIHTCRSPWSIGAGKMIAPSPVADSPYVRSKSSIWLRRDQLNQCYDNESGSDLMRIRRCSPKRELQGGDKRQGRSKVMIRRAAPGVSSVVFADRTEVLLLPSFSQQHTTHTKLDVSWSTTFRQKSQWPARFCLFALVNNIALGCPNSIEFTLLARPRNNHGYQAKAENLPRRVLGSEQDDRVFYTTIRDTDVADKPLLP
jgi:hypothetical protein